MTEKVYKMQLENISKSFPGVKALDDVNITLRAGTVHAIVGENGAGKSTLMKIINGLYKRDTGRILLDGKEVSFSGPMESSEAGIAMIYQELNYFPELTIAENIFMKRQPSKAGYVKWREMMDQAQKILDYNNLSYDPKMKIKDLPIANIQMLEIVKAVAFKAQVIIMDEPTSSISDKEVKMLFDTIVRLKEQGISFLYISHKMDEIFKIADDLTIIRDGKSIISGPISQFTEDSIIAHMVGRSIENIYPKVKVPIGEIVFEAKKLCSERTFKDVSLHVKKGEIVGMAGLVGAGRSEVCRSIFGLDPLDSGEITLSGKPYVPKNVSHAIKNKVLMITEDRKKEGIIGVRSCRENITLASHRVRSGIFMNLKKEMKEATEMSDKLKVRFAGIETTIGSLSGGNQQKVLLARWLMLESDLLILDEPTRGIDIGAKLEIYNIMTDLAKKGYAILMISSELPELLGMCDRIYVMSQGYITGCLDRQDFAQEKVMQLATRSEK
ncbi:monosaccharide ABC transporter ATP-binding protein (CUT2 family) [Lachnotalea glycerini]|uniref:Monosaccharide ABC transporter ATP-binding protein (CUT2 family) n=1 Tax=Lachnotalea glycerini TaxID=1763509 RepID=A0A318ETA5_9FIRM|nr:sugar ABC transporter ATP-binding protein [Lachnotalea glycerini]PXV95502.1 monosaccharide ABC transporter ATP-binding protein (CUT2 family) [Lachnotalea glycerini]RDY32822.1 sugar ABC transporter ATP-binding protein [Lachnotalea glycerini]